MNSPLWLPEEPADEEPNAEELAAEKWLADYEIRYLKHWPALASFTRELCGGLCCFPGCQQAGTEVHHAFYLGEDASAICLTPGVELFYLCDQHHNARTRPDCAHNWRNWKAAKKPPGWSAQQKANYYKLLMRGWQEKRSLVLQLRNDENPI